MNTVFNQTELEDITCYVKRHIEEMIQEDRKQAKMYQVPDAKLDKALTEVFNFLKTNL
jgi:hypothetical protein